ncbi:3-keto-disaccharide hydrolase [Chitinophaga lutea]
MIKMKLLMTAALALSCGVLSAQSKKGWQQLFNGKDLKNWDIKITGHPLNDNNGNTFRVQDGMLTVGYESYAAFNEQYGHIFHKKKFSSYLLVMEYRFIGDQVKGGPGWAFRNSGAMIHSQPAASMTRDQDFPVSIEVQLLGGSGKGRRSTANLCTPGTNVVMNDKLITAHCVDSKSKTYDGDVWVRAEVLVLGDSIVKHIVEGDTVLVYEKPQIGGGNVSHVDPAYKQDGKLLSEGYIALQSESHPVQYRKVELFDLAPYRKDPKKLEKVIAELQRRK